MKTPWMLGLLLLVSVMTVSFAHAATLDDIAGELRHLRQKLDHLETVVKDQQNEINTLKLENSRLRSTAQTVQPAAQRAPGAVSAAFNPEIGVVADIVGKLTESKEDSEGNDKISVRELELVVGHDIDPYSRFDSTLAFSDFESMHLEEAYVSHMGLPYGFKTRLGRMRPKIGKASPMHPDSLETVEMPLVVQRYLGVEGLSRTGLEISNFLPLPYESVTHEVIGGILEGGVGEDGEMFGDTRRRPSFYARVRNFAELSPYANFELGATYLKGSSDEDSSYEVDAFSVDATLVRYFDAVRRLKLQAEAYFQSRDEGYLEGEEHEEEHLHALLHAEEIEFRENPWGMYGLAELRLSTQFALGARYDYVQPINQETDYPDNDWAVTGFLTFYQSEFARWRFQYQYADLGDGSDDHRFFLQGTFAIGTHKHQLQ